MQSLCFYTGVLIANKVDLDTRRVISPKKGQELATNNKLEYFECSAVRLIFDHSHSTHAFLSTWRMWTNNLTIMRDAKTSLRLLAPVSESKNSPTPCYYDVKAVGGVDSLRSV